MTEVFSAYRTPPKVVLDAKYFGKSLTRQSEANACNINTIMAKYDKTGLLPVHNRESFYADVSQMGDYQSALENVRMADDAFMELPAKVRAKFDNEVGLFLDFCSDPGNRDEMVEMGLVEAPAAVAAPAVEPVVSEPVVPA